MTADAATAWTPGPSSAQRVGRYALLDLLGQGGMGAVYRARDESSGRMVAFKQLLSAKAGKKRRTVEALFEREYHTLVRLRHPRIIEVYDYGLSESGPYYTMELLEGKELHQLAPLPFREACRHLRDVASSLALVHAHRLVHRDVSPRNVRLGSDGRAKLIDFGALTGFGRATHLVGTVQCIAPEVLQRGALDQRTDLYALGAVAYWLLTGRHAYPARKFQELSALWRKAPLRPSLIEPSIPPELDSLLLSLLRPDPLARPTSAAMVMDQLTAIADLEHEEHELGAESYLSSGRMVGREDEQGWVLRRLERALQGSGSEVVIDGAAGIGKTRLLHEATLQAQLKGLAVLKTDAQAVSGAFGVASSLALALMNACPEQARRAAQAHAALLCQLSPELMEKLVDGPLVAPALNPAERRARLQTALHEWFLEVARERPLLLAVDNIQAADDNSAAFIAALGQKARDSQLFVIVTQRLGDEVVAPLPLRVLRKRGTRVKLAGLSQAACDELVDSLFGGVANCGRVARLLYDKSAGNPQQCMELAQLLVKKKIAKYAAGTWVLPLEVSAEELPSRTEEIWAIKLAGLSDVARSLVEALSIHARPLSIERCLSLSDGGDERATYAALDQLVADQILLAEGESYRFGQTALREAVLARMDPARRRALQLRTAETLLEGSDEQLEQRMEAAWHLLGAGEETRGAELLANTSRKFLGAAGGGVTASENAEQIVKALAAAIDVYERNGRSAYEVARLIFPMLPFAYYCSDWRVLQRHGERAIRLGVEIICLPIAEKLRGFLGRRLAIRAALTIARLRFAWQRLRGLDYDLRSALASFCAAIPSAVSTYAGSLDAETQARLLSLLRPLSSFGRDELPALMQRYVEANVATLQGREGESRVLYGRLLEHFRSPQFRAAVGEGHSKGLTCGVLFSYGLMHGYCSSSQALECARELEEAGVRTWAMSATQLRLLYHAFRGETEEVQRNRDLVELFAVQGNTTWQVEMFLPAVLLHADVLSGDTIGARRSWEQLARKAKSLPVLDVYADFAHAAYLASRGELSAAIELYEQVLPQLPPQRRKNWLSARAYFADVLNSAGQHARAKQVASEALSHLRGEEHAVLVFTLEPQRQLALAEAGLGNHAEAVRLLEALLAEHGQHDNPLLIGLLHKARAEVALGMGEKQVFERHLAEMEQRFRATRNPALIAQCDRIAERARRAGVRTSLQPASHSQPVLMPRVTGLSVEQTLAELTAAADRNQYALQLVMQHTHAKVGYLYLLEDDAMRLAAASHPHEPPAALEARLKELALRAEVESLTDDEATRLELASVSQSSLRVPDESVQRTIIIESAHPQQLLDNYRTVVLSTMVQGRRIAVGGFVLEVETLITFRVDQSLIEGIAKGLYERGMTTTINSQIQ
jgi:hypothetical protein